MGACWKCGKKGIFLSVDADGLCRSCAAKKKEAIATAELLKSVTLSVEVSMSVQEISITQKTPGKLLPAALDAWAGYISPSGGFVNYARYEVIGINPATNRKNKRVFEEASEEYARKRAEIAGLIGPFEVRVLPSLPPSERQLEYAKDLGITIPDGACFIDVSALISRVKEDDENPAPDVMVETAHIHGLKFSRYHGRSAILRLAIDLPHEDYCAILDAYKETR